MGNIESPIKAIRMKCLDCCLDSVNEVKLCTIENCPLHPFRFGKNPFRKRTLSEEQKQAIAERLKQYRKIKNENEEIIKDE